jgi:hypothetical protein
LGSRSWALDHKFAGSNPLGYDMSRFQLVYNYCRRPSQPGPYNDEEPSDTLSVAFGDSAWMSVLDPDCPPNQHCYMPTDLCHADVYLSRNELPVTSGDTTALGVWPAYYETWDEDVTNRPANTGTRHANSIGIKLPPEGQRLDTTGTGWASPDGIRSLGFGHEFEHGLPAGPFEVAINEQFAAIAEALTGANDPTDASDLPYTWSLLGRGHKSGGTVRGYGSYYPGRTAFGAYLVYNFPGADTSLTLSGMQDDLAHQWITLERPPAGLGTLRNLLGDAACDDCARLLDPPGVPQSDTSRLALLHHYWRAAMYVNNSDLDRGQYGYPSQYGFAPGASVNAWQNTNGVSGDDVVAIPPEITVGPTATRDTVLYGTRSLNGTSYPLTLQLFGAEYWIVRSDAALAASPQDLVIRVWSDSAARVEGYMNEVVHLGAAADSFYVRWGTKDAWILASAVGYSEQNDVFGQPAELWRHPEWATSVVAPQRMDTDSLRGGLELVVPDFGGSTKAVLVPITLADGPAQGFQQVQLDKVDHGNEPFPYAEIAPYTLHLALRAVRDSAANPEIAAGMQSYSEEAPVFAPDGNSVAYARRENSGKRQIYIADLAGQFSWALCPSDLGQWKPDWSPRGDLLAYESLVPMWQWQVIFLCDPGHACEASPLRVSLWGDDGDPTFSPNGQRLAFTTHLATAQASFADSVWQLRRIDLSGENEVVLVQSGAGRPLISPRWSSDGRWIYFVAGDSLYAASCESPGVVVSRAGLAPRVATFDLRPSDGHLVMEEPGAVTYRVEVGDEEGSWLERRLQPFRRIAVRDTARQLSIPWFYRTGAQYYGPRWSPDGTRIAYSADENQAGNLDLYVGQVSYNHAPQFVNAPTDTVLAGACDATLVQSWSANDPDGETVTFSAAYLPAGATVSAQGQLNWSSPGPAGSEHFVVVRALDGSGGIAQKVIRIAIEADTLRPAPVADLTLTMGRTTAAVEWSVPGDDSLSGTPCRTRVAYSTQLITEGTFFSCDTLPTGAPGPAGSVLCAEARWLTQCRRYYFALKTQDDAGHWSALSNVATAMTSCGGNLEAVCGEGLLAQGEGEGGWSLENSLLDLAAEDASVTDIYA